MTADRNIPRWRSGTLVTMFLLMPVTDLRALPQSVVLEYENDVIVGEDRWYTNGVRASWVVPASGRFHDFVIDLGDQAGLLKPDSELSYGFSAGQNMYTPRDITDPDPPEGNRPYAGWLYFSTGVGETHRGGLRRLLLTLGAVGPASLGERTQKEVHRALDTDMPRGWDTQLGNEVTAMLSFERLWRVWQADGNDGWGTDLSTHAGATLGTPYTLAGTGLTVRAGHHMPKDFSPPRIQPAFPGSLQFRPAERWGWYFFFGVDGQGRAHDTFLDGNTFRDSRSVARNPWVGELMAGLALAWRDLRISHTFTHRTREFQGQDEAQRFGAFSLTLQW